MQLHRRPVALPLAQRIHDLAEPAGSRLTQDNRHNPDHTLPR